MYQNGYTSMGGKTYLDQIQKFILTYGFINAIYHIYLDNDIDNKVLYNIKNFTKNNFTIYCHKNKYPGEKDFGVPLNKIQEYIYKL